MSTRIHVHTSAACALPEFTGRQEGPLVSAALPRFERIIVINCCAERGSNDFSMHPDPKCQRLERASTDPGACRGVKSGSRREAALASMLLTGKMKDRLLGRIALRATRNSAEQARNQAL